VQNTESEKPSLSKEFSGDSQVSHQGFCQNEVFHRNLTKESMAEALLNLFHQKQISMVPFNLSPNNYCNISLKIQNSAI